MQTQAVSDRSLMNDASPPSTNKFWDNFKAIFGPYWYPTESGKEHFQTYYVYG
ncbi:hypothetical protein [Halotia branconii]|uniref:Uncharacterized protein n=1 Tax=Halotia branconii CENA392 TaxID=1539056 RepID=A0AAJ6P8W7_9CYAN|nr:hypothetical protein [Halotia branconii]WGV25125.1 hypothetical protein QI031_25765 [Halotia branconii CENA392]